MNSGAIVAQLPGALTVADAALGPAPRGAGKVGQPIGLATPDRYAACMATDSPDLADLVRRAQAALSEIRALPIGQRLKLPDDLSGDELVRLLDALLWTQKSERAED